MDHYACDNTYIVTTHNITLNTMFNSTNAIKPLHSIVHNEKRQQRKVLAGKFKCVLCTTLPYL